MPIKVWKILVLTALFVMGPFGPSRALNEGETVVLRYTYKTEQLSLAYLKDAQGKDFLPLMDLAKFFGVQMDLDSESRRLTLSKGKNKVKLVLSQPVYLVQEPESSYPIDPLEVISGQLGVPPKSAEDLLGTLLGIPVHFIPEQSLLIAGGVTGKEIQQEILAEKSQPTTPTPQPASSAAAVSTPVGSPAAAPSLAQVPTQEMEPTPEAPPLVQKAPRGDQMEKVQRIVIDAGHGGYDAGAPGFDRKYHEKAATLDIAQRVAGFLKEEKGMEVLLTRNVDHFISLKYRTQFANSHNADLFVSIHCNSNPRKEAHGTEIYRYGLKASSRSAEAAAARENFGGNDMDFTLMDLSAGRFKSRSEFLAEHVETHITETLGQHFRNIQEARFYVLAHVDMPSILVETAFISNKEEENKLRDPYWREKMARAIADGILEYKDLVEGNLDDRQARR
jgi:N-acetylmuramoyl-L-alanine amidase